MRAIPKSIQLPKLPRNFPDIFDELGGCERLVEISYSVAKRSSALVIIGFFRQNISLEIGGSGWTRTTDLTLIRGAL